MSCAAAPAVTVTPAAATAAVASLLVKPFVLLFSIALLLSIGEMVSGTRCPGVMPNCGRVCDVRCAPAGQSRVKMMESSSLQLTCTRCPGRNTWSPERLRAWL